MNVTVPNNAIKTTHLDHPDEFDHLYLDINFYNDSYLSPTGPVQYVPAIVQQTRSSPFLNNPGKYNMAIVRFSISGEAVYKVVQPLGTTGGNTDWFVGVEYNGTHYDSPVVIPTSLDPYQKPIQGLYNIQSFLDVINTAWASAQAASAGGGGPTGTGTIFMSYSPTTELYQVNVPAFFGTGTVGATAGNGIAVTMSYGLYQKFNSFNTIQNSPLLYNHHDVTFVREWTGYNLSTAVNLNVGTGGTGITGTYMQLQQEGPWASSVEDIHRLIFTSTSLPVYAEYLNLTNIVQGQGGNNNQILPVIQDYQIGEDLQFSPRAQNFLYTPTLYRLTSLKGSTPLTTFDIAIYVGRKDGTIVPLNIPPYGEISMKLLFLRKGLAS